MSDTYTQLLEGDGTVRYIGTIVLPDGRRHIRTVEVPSTTKVADVRSGYFTLGHGDWLLLRRLSNPTGLWIWECVETPPDVGGYVRRTRAELMEAFGWTCDPLMAGSATQ